MKPILELSKISKRYHIRHIAGGYLSLRERMMATFSFKGKNEEDFWALNDISFSVGEGESIGIIGKNGAGKSTLLKILSRITPPTRGKIITRGRIASLLEVGTGFHPELTGRENIFFNGSLLGMRRNEIARKFDEIVDFSGVERFVDTSLKHYSSGMQLRLAFAVAATLEPEILIIDEVLAVGDAEFQKKCLGKMEDVSRSGRTILFVSHQLGMVSQLCKSAILLQGGQLVIKDDVKVVIEAYRQSNNPSSEVYESPHDESKIYVLRSVKSLNQQMSQSAFFGHDEEICLEIQFSVNQQLVNTNLLVAVNNKHQQRVFSSDKPLQNILSRDKKHYTAMLTIPANTLTPGNYSFFISFHCPNTATYDMKDNVCPITIFDNGSEFVQYENKWFYGDVFVQCQWRFN